MKVNKIDMVYSREPIPDKLTASLFLAGPVARTVKSLEWRPEALSILNSLGFSGTVFLPINRNNEPFDNVYYKEQIEWEFSCCKAADLIVFWIPREYRHDFEMIGLTTNIELGMYLTSNKLIAGSPSGNKETYIKYMIEKYRYSWYDNLFDILKEATERLSVPVPREAAECTIPRHLFQSSQFTEWYKSQKAAGNSLVAFESLFEFVMPKARKLFMTLFQPKVYINSENRIKSNEFVIARTDMTYVCAYFQFKDSSPNIILVKEFRSPVRNSSGVVYELPGGSSLNENDNSLSVAVHELKEETGLSLSPSRFKYVDSKQSFATLCSHKINLYKVELTYKEYLQVLNDIAKNKSFGVAEDTEYTKLIIASKDEILSGKYPADFGVLGMIAQAFA